MTEIPEHLLERSRARRVALGLLGDDEGAPARPAAARVPSESVAEAAPVEVAPVEVAPPPPPSPRVEAALRRKRVPFWALPVLAGLPVWAFMYVGTLEPAPAAEQGPAALVAAGGEIYQTNCSACHGANGSGTAAGRQLSDGEVLLTFPDYEDHIEFVNQGSAAVAGQVVGDPDRPGGARIAGEFGVMPAWAGSLTEREIQLVVLYERVEFGQQPEDESDLLALLLGESEE